jgi:LmbE family N-acetylglucosaminyl deacetylase
MTERTLLLAVYGMEVVEAGGALAAAVLAGGSAHASVMLAEAQMREDLGVAAEHLGIALSFTEFRRGAVAVDEAAKRQLVTVLRTVRPTVVITQDPEHSLGDLDPDRRPAMTLILESIALAGRDWGDDGLDPLAVPTIYYMTPARANCLIDVSGVWERKEAAMDALSSQHEFTAQHYQRLLPAEQLRALVPDWDALAGDAARGGALHRVIDRAVHIAHGVGHHGRFALAEAYRRDGPFALATLPR